jgi:hypothetical protein
MSSIDSHYSIFVVHFSAAGDAFGLIKNIQTIDGSTRLHLFEAIPVSLQQAAVEWR